MKPVLLDTGPVVALLDQADSSHVFVRTALAALPGRRPLLTTGAVITEVMFYLQDSIGGIERAVSFLADAGVYVEDAFTGPRLRAAAALMEQYADTPMDFADATLVVLATHFATGDILTLDERASAPTAIRANARSGCCFRTHSQQSHKGWLHPVSAMWIR